MKCMQRAALYARVSTDAQQKEGTIESQVAELKRQIAAAGHVLVKEYIDDGVPGPLLDRPALNQLRASLHWGHAWLSCVRTPVMEHRANQTAAAALREAARSA